MKAQEASLFPCAFGSEKPIRIAQTLSAAAINVHQCAETHGLMALDATFPLSGIEHVPQGYLLT